jgi:hypothetical protein
MKRLIVNLLTEKGLSSARISQKDDSKLSLKERFQIKALGIKTEYFLLEKKIVVEVTQKLFQDNPLYSAQLYERVVKELESNGARHKKDFVVKIR